MFSQATACIVHTINVFVFCNGDSIAIFTHMFQGYFLNVAAFKSTGI